MEKFMLTHKKPIIQSCILSTWLFFILLCIACGGLDNSSNMVNNPEDTSGNNGNSGGDNPEDTSGNNGNLSVSIKYPDAAKVITITEEASEEIIGKKAHLLIIGETLEALIPNPPQDITYRWSVNGTVIPEQTSNTLLLEKRHVGIYKIKLEVLSEQTVLVSSPEEYIAIVDISVVFNAQEIKIHSEKNAQIIEGGRYSLNLGIKVPLGIPILSGPYLFRAKHKWPQNIFDNFIDPFENEISREYTQYSEQPIQTVKQTKFSDETKKVTFFDFNKPGTYEITVDLMHDEQNNPRSFTTYMKVPRKKREECTKKNQDYRHIGGTKVDDRNTEQACIEHCYSSTTCTAVDWDTRSNQCFQFFDSEGTIHELTGINHYQFCSQYHRNPKIALMEQYCFDKQENHHKIGGTEQTYNNQLHCLEECLKDNTCQSVDWNKENPKCFFHTQESTNKNIAEKVDHYVKNDKCTYSSEAIPKDVP